MAGIILFPSQNVIKNGHLVVKQRSRKTPRFSGDFFIGIYLIFNGFSPKGNRVLPLYI